MSGGARVAGLAIGVTLNLWGSNSPSSVRLGS